MPASSSKSRDMMLGATYGPTLGLSTGIISPCLQGSHVAMLTWLWNLLERHCFELKQLEICEGHFYVRSCVLLKRQHGH